MGKVKKKLPTPDTNPIDGDKLIEETKPKKIKETEEKPEIIRLSEIENDICTLGNWVADIEDELRVMNRLLIQIATRMGLK